MAGQGKRFSEVGYKKPKPLIEVFDKPMIQYVIENILESGFVGKFIFVVLEEHKKYGVEETLRELLKDCEIVYVPSMTDGQLRSAFYAEKHIDSEEPLLIVNSDNYFVWNADDFMSTMDNSDGSILTFNDPEKRTHWSFARIENDTVTEVKEKEPISDCCLGGAFLLRHGSDFIKYGKIVFDKKVTKNGEYYISSVFNEILLDKKVINNYNVEEMISMGTPTELGNFINWYGANNDK